MYTRVNLLPIFNHVAAVAEEHSDDDDREDGQSPTPVSASTPASSASFRPSSIL